MRVSVSPGYGNLPVEFFIDSVALSSEDDYNQRQVPYIQISSQDHGIVNYPHWNGQHLQSDERPESWSEFHFEETIRLISMRLERDARPLTTTLLRQRSQILQLLLKPLWTRQQETYSDDGSKRQDFRNRVLNMNGFTADGQIWQRSITPKYGRIGDNEWAIVLDGRAVDEIITSGVENNSIRCYSSGLRLVRISSIPNEHEIIDFSICLNPHGEQFNPTSYIRYWLEKSVEMGLQGGRLEPYRPLIDVEGHRAFVHELRGRPHGGRPERNGHCVLTSGEPLIIRLDQNIKVELAFKFIDIDGVEKIHYLGFIVHEEELERPISRSIALDNLQITFNNPNEELSRSKQNKLKQDLEYQIYRDLTKAFRILAKRQRNPSHQFTNLYGLGISKSHYRWVIKSRDSEVEQDLIYRVLELNGWN